MIIFRDKYISKEVKKFEKRNFFGGSQSVGRGPRRCRYFTGEMGQRNTDRGSILKHHQVSLITDVFYTNRTQLSVKGNLQLLQIWSVSMTISHNFNLNPVF